MAAKPGDGKPQERIIPSGTKFLIGGLSGMAATCVVQPLDLVKTRMQLTGTKVSTGTVIRDIIQKEGVLAIYTGLGAGLLRQASYTTTRLGCFTYLFDQYKINYGVVPGFGIKMLMGIVAGGIGAFVGTPAEVSLIRMMGDKRLPAEQRRNYTGVFNALGRIIKEEGVLTLWRGTGPTVARAMVVNAAQLGTYSQAREMLVTKMDGILLHFTASMISGLVTTIASMPVDIIKTRIQNAKGNEPPLTVVRNILVKEGVFSLWKGFLPYYARLGPHTTLTFVFLEQINALYFKFM